MLGLMLSSARGMEEELGRLATDGLSWLTVAGLALGLAMDALAVAIAVGLALGRASARQTFRLAFHFGLFQFLMPLLGWAAGTGLAHWIAQYDHWLAFLVLAYVGVRMIHQARKPKELKFPGDPTRGWMLVMLSIATSLDAFGVGLGWGMVEENLWGGAVVIGLVAGLITMIGLRTASRLGARWGQRAEVAGGMLLILIGLKILLEHYCAG
ncbi:MAG: manganese efflux pump MntP family protein [Thermoguttaceae bacterium]|nr:manganese efflux pump MntP family protein [Thermoguttaceae bacterium]MDW8038021.1 manganese efflux pump MntP family protein [Thermoguttaceae bacterium]